MSFEIIALFAAKTNAMPAGMTLVRANARCCAAISAMCLLLTSTHAFADDNSSWLGETVFIKTTARPKVGNKTMHWNEVGMPAKVSKVEGDFLWVGNAWVKPNDVVRTADAPIYYTKVLREEGSPAFAYMLRGVAWRLKHDYVNAEKDFSAAIRLEPDAHMAYQARAGVYHQTHEFEKALADLNEAIRLAPDVGLYYNDRGCVYKSMGEYSKAFEQFNEAVRIKPKLALAYANRGVNWHVQKQYAKAMEDFNQAIKIDPRLTHAYNSRGYVWSKEGHYNEALKDWEESIRIAPDEPGGYHNKARLYATCESLGHRDGAMALENAQKACELSHWDEWIYVATLAAAYAELGQFEDAIKWQKKAIAMDRNPEERDTHEQNERLKLYEAGMPFRDPEVSE